MKRTLLIACGLLPGLVAHAFQLPGPTVVNFSDANNNQGTSYATSGSYNLLYYGQGAFSNPGNNIWNGFGNYAGYSGNFYGPGLTDNPQQSGNPGNPYAAYNSGSGWQSSTGSSPYQPSQPATPAGNATSSGSFSSVTLSLNYNGGDSGLNTAGQQNLQGTPGFLLGEAAVANSGSIGTFALHNVAPGTYSVLLYGANYNNNGGTTFTLSSGSALGGLSQTVNGGGSGPASTFVLGQNYIEYDNVSPDGNGDISGTFAGNNGGSSGYLNGIQLVSAVPEPTTLMLLGLCAASFFVFRRRK